MTERFERGLLEKLRAKYGDAIIDQHKRTVAESKQHGAARTGQNAQRGCQPQPTAAKHVLGPLVGSGKATKANAGAHILAGLLA